VAEPVARRAADAVVANLELHLVGPVPDGDVGPCGVRVLERVGQALLDDSIGREVDRPWERNALAVDVQLDGEACAADLLHQRVQAVEPGLRNELRFVPVAAHRSEETAHLDEGCTTRALDTLEGVTVLGQCNRELVPDGADLEHHHTDGVSDDVVELARDSRPLLCHRDAGGRVPLALRDSRAKLSCLGLLGALAQREAGDPGDCEIDREEDELARGVCRDLVDEDNQTADDDAQADSRLPGVAQVPEQEGDRKPDHEEALHGRDQLPVDERDPGREHPVGDEGAERKAPTGEDREHEDRERRQAEPERRACGIASDDQLEHRSDRESGDQQVEPVLAQETSSPHALNVLHVLSRRLLPG
jgi:hypothetical protein